MTRRKPDSLFADRGYDHDIYRDQVRDRGIVPAIARRGTRHGTGLGTYRWVVERAFAWLHGFRRLRTRWERRADIHEAFLKLACCLITYRQLGFIVLAVVRASPQRFVQPQGFATESRCECFPVRAVRLVGVAVGAKSDHRARMVASSCGMVVDVVHLEQRRTCRRTVRQVLLEALGVLAPFLAPQQDGLPRFAVSHTALARVLSAFVVKSSPFPFQHTTAHCSVRGFTRHPHTHSA